MADSMHPQGRRFAPKPGQVVLLKENPTAFLLGDAEVALEHAREARAAGENEAEASFSRVALLLYACTLEGLINFVYEWCEVNDDSWRSWPIAKKWENAASQCRPGLGLQNTPSVTPSIRDDAELFERFLELKSVRNGMAHAKPVFTSLPENRVDGHLVRDERHPRTGLPKRFAALRLEDAEIAAEAAAKMIERLDFCLAGNTANLERVPASIEFVVDDDTDPWDESDAG